MVLETPLALEKELSHKARVQFFIEEVLHWPAYTKWYEYIEEYATFPQQGYPVCFWDEAERCWMVNPSRDEPSRVFDPYRSLDDAWEILETLPTGPGEGQVADILREENDRWSDYSRIGLAKTICDTVWAFYRKERGGGEDGNTESR